MSARRIAFVVFEGFQALDLAGPHEVFQHAGQLSGGYRCQIVARTAGLVRSASGLPVHAAHGLAGTDTAGIDTLVVAGGPGVDRAVETIARRYGFGTGETLRRAFHRRLGVAPSDYRERLRSTREQHA